MRVLRGVMTLEQVQEWGGSRGKQTRKAVEEALKNKDLIARWNLQGDVDAARERIAAESTEEAEVSEAADEADETDETDEDDSDDEEDEETK